MSAPPTVPQSLLPLRLPSSCLSRPTTASASLALYFELPRDSRPSATLMKVTGAGKGGGGVLAPVVGLLRSLPP